MKVYADFMRGRVIIRSVALIFCAVCLLAWAWSFRVERSVGWALPSGRFTFRLADGRLTLWGPPARTGSATELSAAGYASRLRNSQVVWPSVVLDEQNQLSLASQASAAPDTPPSELLQIADVRQTGGPLLKALEDPDRIAAAHFVLVGSVSQVLYGRLPNGAFYLTRRIRPTPLLTWTQRLLSDPLVRLDASGRVLPHSILIDFNGLRMELWPDGASLNRSAYPVHVEGDSGDGFRVDASSFDGVRDFWHRQLDRRVVGVSAWVMPSIVSVYPLIVAASVVMKHRARLRAGCCRTCSYNLTGNTSGVCPECGTPVANAPIDKSSALGKPAPQQSAP